MKFSTPRTYRHLREYSHSAEISVVVPAWLRHRLIRTNLQVQADYSLGLRLCPPPTAVRTGLLRTCIGSERRPPCIPACPRCSSAPNSTAPPARWRTCTAFPAQPERMSVVCTCLGHRPSCEGPRSHFYGVFKRTGLRRLVTNGSCPQSTCIEVLVYTHEEGLVARLQDAEISRTAMHRDSQSHRLHRHDPQRMTWSIWAQNLGICRGGSSRPTQNGLV